MYIFSVMHFGRKKANGYPLNDRRKTGQGVDLSIVLKFLIITY